MKPKAKLTQRALPVFGTKAETLERLRGHLKTAQILPLDYFSVAEWRLDGAAIVKRLIEAQWAEDSLIVRSSALGEDTHGSSMAGAYASCANVHGKEALQAAVEKVIDSYGAAASGEDQVLVQPMLADIVAAGVAFSCDPNTGAAYQVINYDDTSGRADSVTSGSKNELKTIYLYPSGPEHIDGIAGRVAALLNELVALSGVKTLDIEFAQTRDGDLILLQARPLVITNPSGLSAEAHRAALARISESIRKGLQPHPYLHGKRTIYGVMPDWNPAEIIGTRPKPLALSLYRELVTDAIWAYQRDNYGYGNLRSFPLLVDFEGLPYIDVRVSFNSFIPKELPAELAEKLADYYIERLIQNPTFHDKIEFEIIYSCYTLDLRERMKVMTDHGFSETECQTIAQSLTQLTNRILHRETGLWKKDRDKIVTLQQRHQTIQQSQMDDISKLYWLVEDCKRYGTLPFAGLARVGFIAVQILRSFVSVGIISEQEYHAFLASLECVSTQMAQDIYTMPRDVFLAQYGHLRPGTYDILSPRYDETPEHYFDWPKIERERAQSVEKKQSTFSLSLSQLKKIESYIASDGIELDTIGLLEFIKTGIEGREYAKFVFTRSVSDFLQLFSRIASAHGFSIEDCAYASMHDILAIYSATHDIKDWLSQSIARGKARHQITRSIVLPPLLVSPQEVWQFAMPESSPNYITQKQAEGEVAGVSVSDFSQKIILIESADPGYDWLFQRPIAGFITRYGGVNSHMAIRAGELGIPAIVGAGDILYAQWSRAKRLKIDCMNRLVQVQI